ncbi:MAG: sarcosine oxidase subunit beta, partial [Paraglaciecola sp.]
MKSEVIIIGGGLMGLSTAVHLGLRGVKATVLEKDSPGRHASGVNAGGLRQLNRHMDEIPLTIAAADIWKNIRSLVDSDCDVQFNGQLRVAQTQEELNTLRERVEALQAKGYSHERIVDKDTLYRLVPQLVAGCVGA